MDKDLQKARADEIHVALKESAEAAGVTGGRWSDPLWLPCEFSALMGWELREIVGMYEGSGEVLIVLMDGRVVRLTHHQDCCESVALLDVTGDPADLLIGQITRAEESSSQGTTDSVYDSCTWTFYKLGTVLGSVDLRWEGTSNGYYSESVDVEIHKFPLPASEVKAARHLPPVSTKRRIVIRRRPGK